MNLRPHPDAKLQPWPPPSASGRGSSLHDAYTVRRLIQSRLSERQPRSRVGDGEREARGRVEPGCRSRRHRSAGVAPLSDSRSEIAGPRPFQRGWIWVIGVVSRRPCVRPLLGDRSRQRRPAQTSAFVAFRSRWSGGAARLLAVECDHPAIRGAVIAFVTERSYRRRAWLLLLADCRTSIGDVGEHEPTWALSAACLQRNRSELAAGPPGDRATQPVRHCEAGPADRRMRGWPGGMQDRGDA